MHPVRHMSDTDYWFEEGAYAYKAGITLPQLDEHFPSRDMSVREWRSLQCGWLTMRNEFLESMGQRRLFEDPV